jgi:CDP-diacylglycerol--glycerol-3-phosphate 3-phosphatidyltransferase
MFLRKIFKRVLDAVGGFLNRLGIKPNTITILGILLNIVGAYFLASGHMTLGGIFILIAGPLDAVDGTMARLRNEPSTFGAFTDSVSDRYSELVILGGLMYYFLNQQDWLTCMIIYLAASGSVLVSYVKARAESLGFDGKVGILSRVERFIILAPCLLFNIPKIALWILAIFANFTSFQRIFYVRRQAHRELFNKPQSSEEKP